MINSTIEYKNVVFHVNKYLDGLYRRCNNNCVFCSENVDSKLSNGKLLSISMLSVVLDFLKAQSPMLDNIYIAGGEPTLRNDLCEIIKLLAPFSRNVHMTSNGTFCAPIDVAKKLKLSGLTHAAFSLHGADEFAHESATRTKGSFNAILQSIEAFLNCKIITSINCVVTSLNVCKLAQIVNFLCKRFNGLDCLTFTHYHRQGEACDNDYLSFDPWKFRKYISAAIDATSAYSIDVKFRDFPFCVDDRLEKMTTYVNDIYVVLWDGDKYEFVSEEFSKTRSEKCNNCRFIKCPGYLSGTINKVNKYQAWESTGV